MGNSGNAVNLPATLFDVGEVEEPTTRAKERQPEEEDSPEFLSLIDTVSKRIARRKTKSKTICASVFDRTKHEVEAMMASKDWSACGARHLVALYDLMHAKCYGIEPAELGPSERYNATMFAAGFVRREFGGEYTLAVEYMRWAWTKEIRTEKWRRENKVEHARRIGVRLMFGGALLTDYRVWLARSGQRT